MDQRLDQFLENYLAIMPTAEAFIPAMVDAHDVVSPRREKMIHVLSSGTYLSLFEQKHRAALSMLTIEDLEAITALVATQPSSTRSALLAWASAMAWAGRAVVSYIEQEYDRLLTKESE
jgi:hypothetical protein